MAKFVFNNPQKPPDANMRHVLTALGMVGYPGVAGEAGFQHGQGNFAVGIITCSSDEGRAIPACNAGRPFCRSGGIGTDNNVTPVFWIVTSNEGWGGCHSETHVLQHLGTHYRHHRDRVIVFSEREPCVNCEDAINRRDHKVARTYWVADYQGVSATVAAGVVEQFREWARGWHG